MAETDPTQSADGRRRRQAFDRVVVPQLAVLLHVARTMTAGPHDAEDLVQDTLLRAYRGIDSFDGAHPRAWLFTIMRNARVNAHRRQRPELLDDPEAAGSVADPSAVTPEQVAEARMFDQTVRAALARLPRPMSQVVELVDLDGLSYAEAAAALGIPAGTVMSRLHRGRRKIRGRLAAAGLAPRGGML
ncbi:MAG: sigma-70 family RNA polymerase sigma factor [Acidimicrobiales bacterium]